jgi:hypothetical protein
MATKSKRRPTRNKKKSPRGLMPTPPEVEELLQRLMKERPHSPEAEQRQRDAFNLQYYFGDKEVICRKTPKGLEVVAVGSREIRKLVARATPKDWENLVSVFPDPW